MVVLALVKQVLNYVCMLHYSPLQVLKCPVTSCPVKGQLPIPPKVAARECKILVWVIQYGTVSELSIHDQRGIRIRTNHQLGGLLDWTMSAGQLGEVHTTHNS